ncbi:hypothetical protein [Cellulomonas sp. ATA003]|uniref:hypothetical protein n=1 Tax=Cellulomonas sp. ATA003 TaxID=3073064 RepID=UPI002872DF74|nr:hypothetical protein [Cellulomonas sp. ATA003]WNB84296.1 hypothetical protein REH70_10360 [Cellulomonas sp. ATA003]
MTEKTSPGRHRVHPAKRSRRTAGVTTVLVLIVASGAAMSTWSGFSAQTTNEANSFSTAQISLTDNDTGAYAMFRSANGGNAYALLPGDVVTECIGVTYTSNATTRTPTVKLSATGGAGTLAPDVNVTVTRGTITGTPSWPTTTCGSGFTADAIGQLYTGNLQDFITAVSTTPLDTGTWGNNAAGETHYFQVRAEVLATASQNETVAPFTLAFTSDTN